MASAKEFLAKHGLAIGSPSTIVFNSSGVLQAAALSGASFAITSVDLDGGTDIGADLADADLFLVDDGAGGTNRKSALSRVKKYIYSAVSGDATVSDTGALTIASGSVENAMLAGSIANSKLTNSTVSFGGVSLALGASDATPAFDLSDATNYPTSSLSGTITNAQLAGSIANSKLTNSTITVSDGSNSTATALGGTITFAGTSGEVDVAESSGTVTIGLPSDVTISNDLVVTGDLTVSGTTTTINSNTLNIGDNIITLNSDVTGTPTQNAGIEVERGTGNNVQLRWNETSDKWQFTNDGSTFSDLGAGLTIQEEGSALSTAAQTLNFVGAAVTATGSGTTKTITISGGDIVNDTTPQLGGNLDLNSSNITGTGNINITGTSTVSGLTSISGAQFSGNVTPTGGQGVEIFAPDTSTGQIQSFDRANSNFDKLIIKGDPVEIYDGSTKTIETTNSGVTVTGNIVVSGTVDGVDVAALNTSVSGKLSDVVDDTSPQLGGDLASNGNNINIADSDLIQIGTGNDLQIYHQSDVSYFKSTNASAPIRFQAPGGEVMGNFIPNGAVELYHDGSKKLETTSTGTTVTGTLTATTLAGTLSTAAQANITSLGSLTALTVTGATNLGTVQAETLAIENPAQQHTYTVTVASKTSAHPYTGQGSSNAYFLDGKEAPSIILAPNMTYRFDQSSNTNSGHPLRFYLEADKTTAYTTGVTTNGTAGSSGAYTQIVVTDATPPVLYYQCSAHAYMGSVSSSLTEGRLSDISDVHTTAPTDGQALVWDNSNSYWAPGTVGGALTIQDEGSALSTSGTTLNFVGAGVTASGTGATKTITIPGGSSSLTVQDEGSALSTAATTLNFVGSGVTASGTGATKTITISGGGGGSSLSIKDEGSALSTAATTLNFVGAGVTASGTGAEKTITISGGTAGTQSYTPQPVYAQLGLTSNHTVGTSYSAITTFNTRIKDTSNNNALTSTLGDGKFIIPAGVSKIKLRASVWVDDVAGQVITQFWKNGAIVAGTTSLDVETSGGEFPVAFTRILDVQQNDYFQVAIYGADAGTVNTNYQSRTWFELEVVEGSILGGLGNLSTLQDVHNASPTDGQALVWDNSNSYWAPGTVGAAITVQDEGSALSTTATTLNFVGAGVTASGTGATKTITISGGGGGSSGSTGIGGQFTSGTGNGSATTFTSPINTNLANNLIVSVDGIMQRPTTDYTVSGTTVTFGTAPPAGTAVLVRSFSGAISSKADFTIQNFTANGSNTVYKLAESVTSGDHVLVSINGIIQRSGSDYTYNTGNGNITFDEAPTSGDIISFRTFDLQQSTSATVSDTAPTNPRNGDFWFDSSTAKLYMRYEDGSSNQWVSLSVAGAAGADGADGTPTVYANTSVLPSSGNSVGDLAFATLTKSLHVWDGSEWDRINSGGDELPRLTTVPASTLHLSGVTGANQSVTMVASDPEGFPITYSYDTNPANTNKASIVNHANGVFKIVPSTNSSHAGDFTLRLKASDGVHISSHAIAVSLMFSTNITFDTSVSTINSTYTTNNKVDVTVTASAVAINEQDLALGKGYLEYKIINDGNYPMMGVNTGSHNGSYGASDAQYLYHDGSRYPGGYTTGLSSSGANDIIMIAYDTAAGSHGKVWFGMNGSWQDSLSLSDIASGTGGNSFGSGNSNTNGLRVAFASGGGSADNYRIEIISHTQGAQYTIPTGFTLA